MERYRLIEETTEYWSEPEMSDSSATVISDSTESETIWEGECSTPPDRAFFEAQGVSLITSIGPGSWEVVYRIECLDQNEDWNLVDSFYPS